MIWLFFMMRSSGFRWLGPLTFNVLQYVSFTHATGRIMSFLVIVLEIMTRRVSCSSVNERVGEERGTGWGWKPSTATYRPSSCYVTDRLTDWPTCIFPLTPDTITLFLKFTSHSIWALQEWNWNKIKKDNTTDTFILCHCLPLHLSYITAADNDRLLNAMQCSQFLCVVTQNSIALTISGSWKKNRIHTVCTVAL